MKRLALIAVLCLLASTLAGASEFTDTKELAEQGVDWAQNTLGNMYSKGEGVPQDYAETYVWLSLAGTFGHKYAIENRDIMVDKLSPEALNAAQKRASKLFKEIQSRIE